MVSLQIQSHAATFASEIILVQMSCLSFWWSVLFLIMAVVDIHVHIDL